MITQRDMIFHHAKESLNRCIAYSMMFTYNMEDYSLFKFIKEKFEAEGYTVEVEFNTKRFEHTNGPYTGDTVSLIVQRFKKTRSEDGSGTEYPIVKISEG